MPYSKESKFYHDRQKRPDLFEEGSFKTVPFNHVDYKGKKYADWYHSGTSALAITGKLKSSGKWALQSILIPKGEGK